MWRTDELDLEPPRDPAQRLRTREGPGHWLRRRWREAPSWLGSLVLHLAAVLLLAWLALPRVRPPWTGGMLAGISEEVEFVDPPLIDAGSVRGASGVGQTAVVVADPFSAVQPAAIRLPMPANVGVAQTVHPPLERPLAPPAEKSTSFAVAASTATRNGPLPGARRELPPAAAKYFGLFDRGGDDDVVDRFILYDTGKLLGAAGERAKREFEQLGPSAIPALVRGLNRSASIKASCPVLVITRTLDNRLAETDDPAVLLFAMENAGRRVHFRAPHFQHITKKKQQWEQRYSATVREWKQRLEDALAPRRAANGDKPWSEADPVELMQALDSEKEPERRAALQTISQRGRSFGEGERIELAQALIRQLKHDEPARRQAANEALRALSGAESGPSREQVRDEPARAIRWWTDQWTSYDLARRLAQRKSAAASPANAKSPQETEESRAAAFYKLAAALEARGATIEARKHYRRITQQFPDTSAAKDSQQRLRALEN